MKREAVFVETRPGEGVLRVRGGKTRRVCTVAEACRRLGRSRRQVYRYIESGDLIPAGKVLGRWLLDAASVERLARRPLAVQPLPSRLQRLFPEYDVKNLNAGRDRDLILSRVLDAGSLEDARWAFERYGARTIADFVASEGARRLSPRSLRLWSLYLRVHPRPAPPWRKASPWHDR